MNDRNHAAWLRTRLSAERTLMSCNRTALALISFGFTIYKGFDEFQHTSLNAAIRRPDAPRNFGLSMVMLGSVVTLVGLWQYFGELRYLRAAEFEDIRADEGRSGWPLAFFLTVLLAFVGIAVTAYVAAHM
jgi:putative membrane protein